jgi:hypothetical protein
MCRSSQWHAEAVAGLETSSWDVFLSYSRQHAASVERIATRLKQSRLEPFESGALPPFLRTRTWVDFREGSTVPGRCRI